MSLTNAPDLTQRAPRSARVRLGGYALLPRMLDKGRATIANKNGEFHFNCPLDQHILNFLGIDAEALKKELATGKGDGEILEWIEKNAKHKHSPFEIEGWSNYMATRAPGDLESRQYFHDLQTKMAPKREDVATWSDLLDIDDFVTFGGKA
jgi:hypothetical protein